MSFPKLLLFVSISLFSVILVVALAKRFTREEIVQTNGPIEIALDLTERAEIKEKVAEPLVQEVVVVKETIQELRPYSEEVLKKRRKVKLPEADRVDELFRKEGKKLPFVETITYKSRVPWQKGRPAWISDYASHYKTSRHFIARSLNGKPDYFQQDVKRGDRFNVYRQDKNIQFYLLFYLYLSKGSMHTLLEKSQNSRNVLAYQLYHRLPSQERHRSNPLQSPPQ